MKLLWMRSKGLFSIKITDWSVFHEDKDSIKSKKHDPSVIFLLLIIEKGRAELSISSTARICKGNGYEES